MTTQDTLGESDIFEHVENTASAEPPLSEDEIALVKALLTAYNEYLRKHYACASKGGIRDSNHFSWLLALLRLVPPDSNRNESQHVDCMEKLKSLAKFCIEMGEFFIAMLANYESATQCIKSNASKKIVKKRTKNTPGIASGVNVFAKDTHSYFLCQLLGTKELRLQNSLGKRSAHQQLQKKFAVLLKKIGSKANKIASILSNQPQQKHNKRKIKAGFVKGRRENGFLPFSVSERIDRRSQRSRYSVPPRRGHG